MQKTNLDFYYQTDLHPSKFKKLHLFIYWKNAEFCLNPTFMSQQLKSYLALIGICLIWSTTYFALRIGVKEAPPFLFSGTRQLSTGLLLTTYLKVSGRFAKISASDTWKQVLIGVMMMTLGNGVISWAEVYIPSGLAALVVSVMPIYIALIMLVLDKGKGFNASICSGLILGAIGIVLIFRDNLSDLDDPAYFWGLVASLLASLGWASGTVIMKRTDKKASALQNASIQFTYGGIVLLLISLLFDDYDTLVVVSADSLWALLYLIFIGSLLAYFCYLYALERLPVMVVSTYAYVNPVIALLLGYFLLQERITAITSGALSLISVGVWLVNRGHQKNKKYGSHQHH